MKKRNRLQKRAFKIMRLALQNHFYFAVVERRTDTSCGMFKTKEGAYKLRRRLEAGELSTDEAKLNMAAHFGIQLPSEVTEKVLNKEEMMKDFLAESKTEEVANEK